MLGKKIAVEPKKKEKPEVTIFNDKNKILQELGEELTNRELTILLHFKKLFPTGNLMTANFKAAMNLAESKVTDKIKLVNE